MKDLDHVHLGSGPGLAAEVPARPAATTIVLRRKPLEALFLRRVSTSTFVPNAWIFPGGAVDAVDRRLGGADELEVLRLCAARELFEEAGLWIGPPLDDPEAWRARLLDDPAVVEELVRVSPPSLDRLVCTSRWVTPVGVPKRYDTWFFLLRVDDHAVASVEGREGVELAWLHPREALARYESDSFPMVFPTLRNLEAIAAFDDADALIDSRRAAAIEPTRPILTVENGRKVVRLPDTP